MKTRPNLLTLGLLCLAWVGVSDRGYAATIGFQPAVIYPVGRAPVAVASGDFNADGKADLAVNNGIAPDDGNVSILLGNGDGTFQPANDFAAGKNPASIAVGDFNGDHRLDVITANNGNNTVSVLLGNGDGTFQAHVDYATGTGPNSVAIGDFNGDGQLDLVVVNSNSAGVSVLLGNGDGTFQAHADYGAGAQFPQAVAVADFNGDGKADLAVAGSFSNTMVLGILLGNGDGTFQPAVSYGAGFRGVSIAAGDFNGDSKLDLVVSRLNLFTANVFLLLLGNGDGTFSQGAGIATGACRNGTPVAADFDGDRKLDLAVFAINPCFPNPPSTQDVLVLGGNGDGTFQSPVSFGAGSISRLGAAADLNGDKAPDLIALNSNNTISVLLNTGTDFSIAVASPTPATVSRGQSSTSTVTVTLLNGFDNPVALTCSVQPAQAGSPTCSLSPSSVTPPPNGTATATLTINTAATTASVMSDPLRRDSRPLQVLWLPVAGLALMGVGLGSTRSSRRKLTVFVVGGMLFAGVIFQAACGGGSSGHRSTTYTITVTGTSGSTQHSTITTLTVQ